MKEIEYKFMINAEQFYRILYKYNFEKPIKQVNYYYVDSEKKIRKNHITVRVRDFGSEMYLQIKFGNKEDYSCAPEGMYLTVREEYSRKVTGLDDVKKNEIEQITGIQLKDIMNVGHMITFRYRCHIKDGINLCLDKNLFLDMCDYEIEVELEHENEPGLELLFRELALPKFTSERLGKCSRFMQQLAKRG